MAWFSKGMNKIFWIVENTARVGSLGQTKKTETEQGVERRRRERQNERGSDGQSQYYFSEEEPVL